MVSIALFGTILGFHYIISAKFYFYLQYFQQKIFSFNKISESHEALLAFFIICVDVSSGFG